MEDHDKPEKATIQLSKFTEAYIKNLRSIKKKSKPDEHSTFQVSQTISFFAIAYEKLRNAVEYRENHLIRRATIHRILKRRMLLNPEGTGEGENLIRELLWARYFDPESLGIHDAKNVQAIINKYLILIKKLPKHQEFLFDLLTCEIEEGLSPESANKNRLETFFIYQVLKDKVQIQDVDEDLKNAYFYVALEKNFITSDIPYLRFHLFTLFNEQLSHFTEQELIKKSGDLPKAFAEIDSLINNKYSDRIRSFVKNHVPPFKILFEMGRSKTQKLETVLKNAKQLWETVDSMCSEKYKQTSSRLNNLAIKAIIYIFLTKAIFALILEYPLSVFFYGEAHMGSLLINTFFPPVLMFLMVGLTRLPTRKNTERIYHRITNIIDADNSFETTVSAIIKRPKTQKPTLIFVFTIIYFLTFIFTFYLLYLILSYLNFNPISQLIFVFFVSLVAFFAYRISQVAREYKLREKETFFKPFGDFFFLPFLSVGKFLSRGIAKLNFLGVILDFIIETPFKLIIEIFEEWISFLRARKEEIA